jgi:hypothetical protein
MENEVRPNKAEVQFLTLSYNRFYDIFKEVIEDGFLDKDPYYRLSKIKDAFSVYSELLNYEPIKWAIEEIKKKRPPMEGEIGSELFKFIRNVLSHFPFFDSWDSIWISQEIISWYKEGQSIDRFLAKYSRKKEVKYRFWEADKKRMIYLSIKFPQEYKQSTKIFLKDILTEKEGIKFSFILMKQIMDTQVINE